VASVFYTIEESTLLIGNAGGQPHVCRLLDGSMIAAIRNNDPTPDTKVYRSDTDGVTWSVDGTLDSTLGTGNMRQVLCDNNQRITICSDTKTSGNGAHYVHRTGPGAFTSRFVATSTATALIHAFFARDTNAVGHVVVVPQTVGEIRYWRQDDADEDNTGTAWTGVVNEQVVAGASITNSSKPVLILDRFDLPHVIYYDGTDERYKHTMRIAGVWTAPGEIFAAQAVHLGDFTSPVLGVDREHIYFAFYAGAVSTLVRPWLLTWDGASWSAENIDATYTASSTDATSNHGTSQDLNGRVYAYFTRDNDTAYFARNDEGAWSKEVIDFGGTSTQARFGTACQPYPLADELPNYPSNGGQFCGLFNNGVSQAIQFAYLAGDGLTFDPGGALLRGFAFKGAQATSQLLTQLMMAYDIVVQDRDGVTTFLYRSDLPDIDLPDDALGAFSGNTQPSGEPVIEKDQPDDSAPRECTVKFMDADRNYQGGSQSYRNQAYSVDLPMIIEFPLSMTNDDATVIARRVLWVQQANRSAFEIPLPPSLLTVREYDRLHFTAFGEARTAICAKVDRGSNLQINVEALSEVPEISVQSSETEGSDGFRDGEISPPSELQLEILDFAPLATQDEMRLVIYFAAAALNPDAHWAGGTIFVSTDNITFTSLRPIAIEATVGNGVDVLPEPLDSGVWDRAHTVDVQLVHGSLSSATEAQVLSGLNHAVLGQECIAFADATLIGANRYRLSTLLRGLRNTERFMDRHLVNERFVYLNGGGLLTQNINANTIGLDRWFKAVPAGGVVADAPSKKVTLRGGSMLPWSAAHIEGTRDLSDNLTITWVRRSRSLATILGPAAAPLLDVPESYEVDIYDGDDVVRTIAVSTPLATYSATDQTTDFGSPQDPVNIAIYQISPTLGRGRTFRIDV